MLESLQLYKLQVGEREIDYKVTRKIGTKNVHMTLKQNLVLEVSMPTSSRADVNAILKKKTGWIKRKLDEISETKKVFDGQKVLYKGDHHRLAFAPSPSQHIRMHNGIIVLPSYASISLKQVLKDWMRKETEKLVKRRLEHFGRSLKLTANGFSVRDTRKWAYCTKDGRIVFNPQLIALPDQLADYVILHELTHLKEFNHSKRFKYALASVCPDFKEKELLLKQFIALD